MRKNDVIHKQEIQLKSLRKKIYKLTQMITVQGSGKPWYKKFTNSDDEVAISDVNDVSDLVRGNGLDKREIGERIISDL